VFGNVDVAHGLVGDGPEQRRLEQQMADAWVSFARTGSLGHAGLPPWPPYGLPDRPTMIIDRSCRIEMDPRAEERRALEQCPAYDAAAFEGGAVS
jgi:para-nitrobenzyl esterase